MPIGKNSIKRVANAGYSSVKTEAPDMENSTVTPPAPAAKKKTATAKAAPVTEKVAPVSKKGAPKKKKETLVTAAKFAVGDELPTYLL